MPGEIKVGDKITIDLSKDPYFDPFAVHRRDAEDNAISVVRRVVEVYPSHDDPNRAALRFNPPYVRVCIFGLIWPVSRAMCDSPAITRLGDF